MFGLLTRKNKARPAARQARPRLETLEDRDVPSTLTLNVTYGPGANITLTGTLSGTSNLGNQQIVFGGVASGGILTNSAGTFAASTPISSWGTATAQTADGTSNVATANVTDSTPVIYQFWGSQNAQVWTFTGTVVCGHNPSDVILNFSGAPVSIQNETCGCDSTGHFSLSVLFNGTSNDNGPVSVQAVDPWGMRSEINVNTTFYVMQSGT